MAEVTRLVVYDSVLFERYGEVGKWARRVALALETRSIEEAPFNKRAMKSSWYPEYPPGSLKASIYGDADRIGTKHYQIVVAAEVPYATYVINGTIGPIEPTDGPFMTLPNNPEYSRRRRHRSVSGQAPNNFFARAAERVAVTHPTVRGLAERSFLFV